MNSFLLIIPVGVSIKEWHKVNDELTYNRLYIVSEGYVNRILYKTGTFLYDTLPFYSS